jgi:hypothetical protein
MNRAVPEVSEPSTPTMIAMGAMRHERETLVELLFDSFSQSTTPGTRSTDIGRRQLLYRVEPYQIDLQIESTPDHSRLMVTGQLLDVTDPKMLGPDIPVTLSNLRGDVVKTATNELGEFHAELENSDDLELLFFVHTGKPFVVLLRDALGRSAT